MTRFKHAPQVNEGKIFYGDNIVDEIVTLAVQEIPNVALYSEKADNIIRGSAVKVRREKDDIHVDVSVKIHVSQSVSDIAFKIQEAVRHTIESMTELHVASVNVNIEGLLLEEKVEQVAETAHENTETVHED